jgi:raffinose synthase
MADNTSTGNLLRSSVIDLSAKKKDERAILTTKHLSYDITNDVLAHGGKKVLSGCGDGLDLEPDACGVGVFVMARALDSPRQRQEWKLGQIEAIDRFMACRLEDPFWMVPVTGNDVAELPEDTQFLLVRRENGSCLLFVPLYSEDMRFALRGKDGHLELVGDTADVYTVSTGGLALFVAEGKDPYTLMPAAAASVTKRLGKGQLRRAKKLPPFVDLFGWCTWDAFYNEVSHEKVREGLESFAKGNVSPRFMILDAGWQSTQKTTTGEERLTSFVANDKFPGDLRALVDRVKKDYGIEYLIAWHALMGYWGGTDGKSLEGYGVRDVIRRLSPSLNRDPKICDWQGLIAGVIPQESAGQFLHEYHAHLKDQGVDGVKVDNQAAITYLSDGVGGRVRMFNAYRKGLESSTSDHFDNTLIVCMAGVTELCYDWRTANVTRTSTDFWPDIPASHGQHLWANACVSLWVAEFLHPDWDMFQSGHAMGSYHAAGRAISGSSVYVSDKPDAHDFDVLRKLVCTDGTILRCTAIGRPCPDCLFRDPTSEDVLLKIFNFNEHGAVVGVFHSRTGEDAAPRLSGTVSPSDIPGLPADSYAVMSHRSGEVRALGPDDSWEVSLERCEWEIFSLAPLQGNTAVLGLADKYNSGGAIRDLRYEQGRTLFHIRDGGTLVFYADRSPESVTVDGEPAKCERRNGTDAHDVLVPAAGEVTVTWKAD